MSPVRFRPEIRVPWQALATFAVAVYLVRSALRGWDLRPDLADALVFGGLAAILLARVWLGRHVDRTEGGADAAPPSDDHAPRD